MLHCAGWSERIKEAGRSCTYQKREQHIYDNLRSLLLLSGRRPNEWAPNEPRNHLWRFACLACKPLHHLRCTKTTHIYVQIYFLSTGFLYIFLEVSYDHFLLHTFFLSFLSHSYPHFPSCSISLSKFLMREFQWCCNKRIGLQHRSKQVQTAVSSGLIPSGLVWKRLPPTRDQIKLLVFLKELFISKIELFNLLIRIILSYLKPYSYVQILYIT